MKHHQTAWFTWVEGSKHLSHILESSFTVSHPPKSFMERQMFLLTNHKTHKYVLLFKPPLPHSSNKHTQLLLFVSYAILNLPILYFSTLKGQKYSAATLDLWIQGFSAPLPQVCKVKHVAMQPPFTNIYERMGCFIVIKVIKFQAHKISSVADTPHTTVRVLLRSWSS